MIAATDARRGLAAKAATTTIPIVFATGDPVKVGLVASLNRPGGNVTGVSFLERSAGAEAAGAAARAGAAAPPRWCACQPEQSEYRGRAEGRCGRRRARSGCNSSFVNASSDRDIDTAFATFAQQRADALLGRSDAFFTAGAISSSRWRRAMRCRRSIALREFTEAGGLMSYGASTADAYRQAGIYTGRILKGEKPADLPVDAVRPSSSSSSTSRPPRRSASTFRRRCSRSPTR